MLPQHLREGVVLGARRQLPAGRPGRLAWAWMGLSCVALVVLSFTVGHG
jgi:hypothetical protein